MPAQLVKFIDAKLFLLDMERDYYHVERLSEQGMNKPCDRVAGGTSYYCVTLAFILSLQTPSSDVLLPKMRVRSRTRYEPAIHTSVEKKKQ